MDDADLFKRIVDAGVVRFGEFEFVSGRTSPYKLDMERAFKENDVLGELAWRVCTYVPRFTKAIASIGGAVPLGRGVAQITRRPFIELTKENGIVSGCPPPRSSRVFLVDDVATTGLTLTRYMARPLREEGLEVAGAGVVASHTPRPDLPFPVYALYDWSFPGYDGATES